MSLQLLFAQQWDRISCAPEDAPGQTPNLIMSSGRTNLPEICVHLIPETILDPVCASMSVCVVLCVLDFFFSVFVP